MPGHADAAEEGRGTDDGSPFCRRNRTWPQGEPCSHAWWRRMDSNHRRQSQQIYSLSPLATWVLLPMKLAMESGAGGRIRTPDLLITNQLLYQLSYTSTQHPSRLQRKSLYQGGRGLSTLLEEKNQKKPLGSTGETGGRIGVWCGICQGELYPGEPYFLLEGQSICEACLERYARRRFAHQLRWVGRKREERANDDL